jgi:transcriptional regulator with XRE-family HTH domain
MTTKLNEMKINSEYKNLFSFANDEERIIHNSQMISYRILSEVENLCLEKKIKKKELADLMGTSKSYITQLFTGKKSINTYTMAKFEDILNMHFEIRVKLDEESYEDFFCKQINMDLFTKRKFSSGKGSWFYCPNTEKTDSIIKDLKTENKQKQKVA